jgi:hypothetical protein
MRRRKDGVTDPMAMSRERGEPPKLVVPRAQAARELVVQLEKGQSLPDVSINENSEAHRWYKYTAELLRQTFTSDEITNEFTGRGTLIGGDINTGSYLNKLRSIIDRLGLYAEGPSRQGDSDFASRIASLDRVLNRFHLVARQLRQRYGGRPTLDVADEYDAQNLLHSLLTLYFDDIRAEEWTPSYAGSSSRMDFLLKRADCRRSQEDAPWPLGEGVG